MAKLGQHFLKSQKIVDEIIKAAELKPADVVLEIGPGKGILTEALVKKAGLVVAVEKDKELVQFLKEKFTKIKNLKIISGDILKINAKSYKLKAKSYKIVANIPYYITSRVLRNFLSAKHQPELMVIMVQKEVAERIVAKNKKESLLSISVKAYGRPQIIKKVPAGHFSPPPKVDSAILKISNISLNFFNYGSSTPIVDEKRFFEMVKKGFSQKRKMLKNNLIMSEVEPRSLLQSLEKCGLDEKIRAEDLRLNDWKCLYLALFR